MPPPFPAPPAALTPPFPAPPVTEPPPPHLAPTPTRAAVLARHASLAGRLRAVRIASEALGVTKWVYVYEPPGYDGRGGLPLVWLFRGHEREWVNIREDGSRVRATAIEDLDRGIVRGALPPVVAVMPGLASTDNHVHSAGLDMAGPLPQGKRGLGTGQFWTYLSQEVIPRFDARYRPSQRLAFGFSLGGYVVSLLAFGWPGYLDHAAFYDALFCWPGHDDPRVPGHQPHADRIWAQSSVFTPALGLPPRPADLLDRCNTTDWLLNASPDTLDAMRRTTFWIQCAGGDGGRGNRDRAHMLVRELQMRGQRLGYENVVLAPFAQHNWHWCDVFFGQTLLSILAPHAPAMLRTGAPA